MDHTLFCPHPEQNNYSTCYFCHQRDLKALTDGSFGTVHGGRASKFGLGPPDACVKRLWTALVHNCGKKDKQKIESFKPEAGILRRTGKHTPFSTHAASITLIYQAGVGS